jgi:hypothetical protein
VSVVRRGSFRIALVQVVSNQHYYFLDASCV